MTQSFKHEFDIQGMKMIYALTWKGYHDSKGESLTK